MYPVSEEYLNTIRANVVDLSDGGWSGTMTLMENQYDFGGIPPASSVMYAFTQRDLAEGGTTITRDLGGGDMISIGGTGAAELSMKLRLELRDGTAYYLDGKAIDTAKIYNAKIALYFKIWLNSGVYEVIPIGTFYVTEAKRQGNIMEITAYDSMLCFEKELGDDEFSTGDPYDYLHTACSKVGVTLANTRADIEAMPNGTAEISMEHNPSLTYREVISDIGEILCANMMVGRDNSLRAVQYRDTTGNNFDRRVEMSDRYTSDLSDFTTRYSSVYVSASDGMEEIATEDSLPGLEYDLSGNIFLTKANEYATCASIVSNIYRKLSSIRYIPYELSCPIDPSIDPMDTLGVIGWVSVAYGPITSIEMSIGGGMSIKSAGSNPRFKKVRSKLSSAVSKVESGEISGGSGTKGSGATYYHYVNESAISATDGGQMQLAIDLAYSAQKDEHIDFHGEMKYELTGNGIITVTYALDGTEVSVYHPVETEQGGNHVLNLVYFWTPEEDVQSGTFKAYVSVTGGNISIQPYAARGYLCCRINSETPIAIELEQLSVTANGTYTAESGHGYDEVEVNVPPTQLDPLNVTENGTYTPDEGKGYGTVTVNVGGIVVTDVSAVAKRMIGAKQAVKLSLSAGLYQDTIDDILSDDASQQQSTTNGSGMATWDKARSLGPYNNTYPTTIFGAQNKYNSSPMAISTDGNKLWITINKNIANLVKSGSSFSLSTECKTVVYDLESGSVTKEIPGTCIIAFFEPNMVLLANVAAVPWITRQLATITSGNSGYLYGLAISCWNHPNLSPYHLLYDMDTETLVRDFSADRNTYGYGTWFSASGNHSLVTYPDMGYSPRVDSDPWYVNGFNAIYVKDTYASGIVATEIGYSSDHDGVVNRWYGAEGSLPFAKCLYYFMEDGAFVYRYMSGDDSEKMFRNLWTTNYNFSGSYSFFALNDKYGDYPWIYIESVSIVVNHDTGAGYLRNKNIGVVIKLRNFMDPTQEEIEITLDVDCSDGTPYDNVVIDKEYGDTYACYDNVLYVFFCERTVYDDSGNKIGELPCSIGIFSSSQPGFTRYTFSYERSVFFDLGELMLGRTLSSVHDVHTVLVPGSYILFVDEYGDFLIYDLQSQETYAVNFLTYIKAKKLFPSSFSKAVRLSRNSNTANKNCDYVVASSQFIVAMVELERPNTASPSRSPYGLGIYKMEVSKKYVMEPALIGYAVNGASEGSMCAGKLLPSTAPSSIIA